MTTVSQNDGNHKREKSDTDPIADHPIVKQLVADVKDVQARQARMEIRQSDFEQSVLLVRGMMERIHERQERIEGYLTKIIEQNDALYKALVPAQEP